jgi:hypothetical protein
MFFHYLESIECLSGNSYFSVIPAISPPQDCEDKLWPESPMIGQWIPAYKLRE